MINDGLCQKVSKMKKNLKKCESTLLIKEHIANIHTQDPRRSDSRLNCLDSKQTDVDIEKQKANFAKILTT